MKKLARFIRPLTLVTLLPACGGAAPLAGMESKSGMAAPVAPDAAPAAPTGH